MLCSIGTPPLQQTFQLVQLFCCRCPTGDKAADGMVQIGLAPVCELDILRQSFHGFVGQDNKLLVGGRVDEELAALLLENLLHAHGHIDGVARQLEIQIVRKQRIKLQTYQCSLGYDGTMLLLDGEEVLVGLTVGEDDSLATEGANLRATNVEDVTVAGQVGQGDVAPLGHQSVAQSGTIYIKRYVVVLAYLIDIVQLLGRIQRTQLRREGDVHQSGEYSMGIVAVVHEVVQILVERLGIHLAQFARQRDDLVLGELYGTGLMDVDMTCVYTDDTLILIEHGVDGGGIGLRAARQEKYLGIGHPDSLTDAPLGTLRERVKTIGCGFLIVILDEVLQHFRVGTVVIITFK